MRYPKAWRAAQGPKKDKEQKKADKKSKKETKLIRKHMESCAKVRRQIRREQRRVERAATRRAIMIVEADTRAIQHEAMLKAHAEHRAKMASQYKMTIEALAKQIRVADLGSDFKSMKNGKRILSKMSEMAQRYLTKDEICTCINAGFSQADEATKVQNVNDKKDTVNAPT